MPGKNSTPDDIVINSALKALIPPLSDHEFSQLEQNILAEGVRDSLLLWGNTLIDGHNRFAICEKHGLEYCYEQIEFDSLDDAKLWMINNQLGRRNLSDFTRCELVLRKKPLLAKLAKAKEHARKTGVTLSNLTKSTDVREDLATEAGVSVGTLHVAEKITKNKNVTPELKSALRSGSVATSVGAEIADLPKDKQREVLEEPTARAVSKATREAKAEQKRQQKDAQREEHGQPELPDNTYAVIYADPPWQYEFSVSDSREIENQYPTMTLDEICQLAVADMAADDAVLYMWTTSPKLRDAFAVLDAWGFQYKTCAVWDKQKMGMGYYFRQQHELLLVATTGSLPAPDPSSRVSSVLSYPRGKHSAKPPEIYDLIDAMYPHQNKIELFSRSPRQGWAAWGNQADESCA